jgi:DNA-binding Xre family transcriptional regulator
MKGGQAVDAVLTPQTIDMPGTIQNRVSEIAGKMRLQIADLAKSADISYDTAKRYWYGDANGITWDVLAKLCDTLDSTPSDLFPYVPGNSDKKDR